MKKHSCKTDVNREYIRCEETKDGSFYLTAWDDALECAGGEVRFCPICGKIAPKYLKTCAACGVNQKELGECFYA